MLQSDRYEKSAWECIEIEGKKVLRLYESKPFMGSPLWTVVKELVLSEDHAVLFDLPDTATNPAAMIPILVYSHSFSAFREFCERNKDRKEGLEFIWVSSFDKLRGYVSGTMFVHLTKACPTEVAEMAKDMWVVDEETFRATYEPDEPEVEENVKVIIYDPKETWRRGRSSGFFDRLLPHVGIHFAYSAEGVQGHTGNLRFLSLDGNPPKVVSDAAMSIGAAVISEQEFNDVYCAGGEKA